jgi:MFS family permease
VGAFAALGTLASIVAYPVWGRLSDRFGNKPVLAACAPVAALTLVLWTFTVHDARALVLVLVGAIHALNGLATAGLDVASNNLLLKLAPEPEAAAYLAAASLTRAVASAAGPLLGGVLAGWFAARSLSFDVTWISAGGAAVLTPVRLSHYDFVFLAAAAVGLYAVHRLAAVREEGEAPRRELLRALRGEVASVGTLPGLRRFAAVGASAVGLARALRRAEEARREEAAEPQAAGPGP